MKSQTPKQYARGWTEFYKLKFNLTPDVLIPRPETELLIDETIHLINHELTNQLTILDIGTGSGCIAIALAKNLFSVRIIATDISTKALKVAQLNAKIHQVENKVQFLKGDLLSCYVEKPDIIVANLPYIPTQRISYLDPSVKDFEPKIALDGGEDGFELYRKLFSQMKEKNIIPKYLICEIDYTHEELAYREVLRYFPKTEVEVKKDLAKKQRILVIKF